MYHIHTLTHARARTHTHIRSFLHVSWTPHAHKRLPSLKEWGYVRCQGTCNLALISPCQALHKFPKLDQIMVATCTCTSYWTSPSKVRSPHLLAIFLDLGRVPSAEKNLFFLQCHWWNMNLEPLDCQSSALTTWPTMPHIHIRTHTQLIMLP